VRKIQYKKTIWLIPWKFRRQEEIHRFILDIPYGLYWSVVPSRAVLNELVRRGSAGGGMGDGLIWDSFEVGQAEYEEILQNWKTSDLTRIRRLKRDDVPDLSFIFDEEIMAIPGHLDYLRRSREKYEHRFRKTTGHARGCAFS
jgi:hypothetical protein